MNKFEKASTMINLMHGIDTYSTIVDCIVSVWNKELSDTFDICISKEEVTHYENLYNNSKKYARKCALTGNGINSGYVVREGEMYIKDEENLIAFLRKVEKENNQEYDKDIAEGRLTDEFLLQDYYHADYYYHTEWEDEDDYQYIEIDGELHEIA
tara:strand:+ start:6648 stop:7112 length:465 start_codon:yes stop_codon:yes gene_type:complete